MIIVIISVLKNERVDELIIAYKSEFDLEKRIEIGKEIDKIVAEVHPVSYGIKRLYRRFLYWDKFDFPEYMVDRFVGNYESIYKLWWFDPEKISSLDHHHSIVICIFLLNACILSCHPF